MTDHEKTSKQQNSCNYNNLSMVIRGVGKDGLCLCKLDVLFVKKS